MKDLGAALGLASLGMPAFAQENVSTEFLKTLDHYCLSFPESVGAPDNSVSRTTSRNGRVIYTVSSAFEGKRTHISQLAKQPYFEKTNKYGKPTGVDRLDKLILNVETEDGYIAYEDSDLSGEPTTIIHQRRMKPQELGEGVPLSDLIKKEKFKDLLPEQQQKYRDDFSRYMQHLTWAITEYSKLRPNSGPRNG